MFKRIIMALAVCSSGFSTLHAANEVSIGSLEGAVGQKIDLSVSLTTDSQDAVGAEIHIPLPAEITLVEGSCVKSDSRLPRHDVSADIRNGELVAVIFNTSLTPIPTGSGIAFKIQLDLGENPGVFPLTPTARLSNASGLPISITGKEGTLTVKGARLEIDETDIDFGRVPIRGTYKKSATATNTGTTILDISGISSDVPGLSVKSSSDAIAPGEKATLELTYSPTERANSMAGRFTVNSNSVGRSPFVRVTSIPFSVNELHIGSGEGVSDSELTISVSMNNMEPITGCELVIPLPEGIEYVDESLEVSSLASMFSVASSFGTDRKLRLILFSIDNTPIGESDGKFFSFKLDLNGRSGTYTLRPEKAVLSNANSEDMLSAITDGKVVISSPSMSASDLFDIGNVPLSGTNIFNYELSNVSSVPLTIERVAFLNDLAECNASFPIVVRPQSSGSVPVTIKSPEFGDFATVMNLYTNDPDNRLKSIEVKGHFYSANELSVKGRREGENYVLTASLTNEADIVAVQLDLCVPEGVVLVPSDLQLLERAQEHTATLAEIGKNTYRLIIFSLNNSPFNNQEGGIFSLKVKSDEIEGKSFLFKDIILSNSHGVNFTNPNYRDILFTFPVFTGNLVLSKNELTLNVEESSKLEVTFLPENVDETALKWISYNDNIATVSNDGTVTGIGVGTTIIKVLSAEDENIFAECKVTVDASTDIISIESIDPIIRVENRKLMISGLSSQAEIMLANSNGRVIYLGKYCGSDLSIEVSSAGIYFLRYDGRNIKILVK